MPRTIDGVSPFAARVYAALKRIPRGRVITYAALARRVATSYRDAIRDLAGKPTVAALYERTTAADMVALAEELPSAGPAKETAVVVEKARRRTQERAIARLTEEIDGERRFTSLITPSFDRPASAARIAPAIGARRVMSARF